MNRPIKVLYIHHGSGQDGASNSLLRLIQQCEPAKIDPILVYSSAYPKVRFLFEQYISSIIDLPIYRLDHVVSWWPLYTPRGIAKTFEWLLLKYPRSLCHLRKVLQKIHPDIVHLNSLTIAPLAPMIKRLGIPVVLHVREPVASGTFGFRRRWLRYLATHYTDHVIYICKDNQNRLTGPMSHSSVQYNPIPLDKFDKTIDGLSVRRELGISETARVLFFPGGSNLGIKGIFPFLKALAIVLTHRKNVYTIIPGIDKTPSIRNQERLCIEKMISTLKLNNTIIRAPFTNAVENYYAASDIVVAPFIKPHFSLAVIEAGAMAKPIIASRLGGIEELLSDRENGLLVEPNDYKGLAEVILKLVQDNDLYVKMASIGYKQSRNLCDAQKYSMHMIDLYERLVDKRRK